MAGIKNRDRFAALRFRIRTAFLLALGLAVLFAQTGGYAQTPVPLPNPLPYSTGYLVTGDFVAGSVDLTGSGTGTIQIGDTPENTVPPDADILAAFLYFETIAPTFVTAPAIADFVSFRGEPIKSVRVKAIRKDLTGPTAACYTAGGRLSMTMTMFRADVLSLLPRLLDKNGKPTGKLVVNGGHTVTLPDAVGNSFVQGAGASLVLVYRDLRLGLDPPVPLRKIVVHDGIHIQEQGATTTQKIGGIYQSDPSNVQAKIMHIVGSGADNTSETLSVQGSKDPVTQSNPFPGTSKSSDRSWAAVTLDVSSTMPGTEINGPYGEMVISTVTHSRRNPFDCLAWAATWFSATVLDAEVDNPGETVRATKGDGIPDRLEQPGDPVLDPNGVALPNLYMMGSRVRTSLEGPYQKDILIEINALEQTAAAMTHGSTDAPYDSSSSTPPAWAVDFELSADGTRVDQVTAGSHTHMPSPEVVSMFLGALKDQGITPHIDLGDAYDDPLGLVDDYRIRDLPSADLARGGELTEETACISTVESCHFPAFPGAIGWGFSMQKHMRGTDRDPADSLFAVPRFDRNRNGLFHYILYAHWRGKPTSLPCLDAPLPFGTPTLYPSPTSTTCPAGLDNPDFEPLDYHVPTTSSGAGDLPGPKVVISLGGWENFTGTPFVQASTTVHELLHNLGIWHGGAPARLINDGTGLVKFVEPNCKPNYSSVASYLFQVHGQKDASNIPRIALSNAENATLNETALQDMSLLADEGLSLLTYKAAWFAPLTPGTLVHSLGFPAATKLCPGGTLPAGVSMARFEAQTLSSLIDWATDGFNLGQAAAHQDINLDGIENGAERPLTGFNDRANLRLEQVGGGYAMGGAISNGGEEFGGEEFGGEEFGGEEFGGEEFGGEEFGGISGFGGEEFGGEEFGGVDLDAAGFGSSDFGGEEFGGTKNVALTRPVALALTGGGGLPPTAFKACVIGPIGSELPAEAEARCPGGPTPLHRIRLSWEKPGLGTVFSGPRPDDSGADGYEIERYRVNTDGTIDVASKVEICGTATTPSCGTPADKMTFDDEEEIANDVTVRYFANTVFVDNDTIETNLLPRSAPTDATVMAVNDPPEAIPDVAVTNEDTSVDIDVVLNDTDSDSPMVNAFLRVVPSSISNVIGGTAVLLNDGRTVRFTPAPDAYGPGTLFGFSYRVTDPRMWTSGNPPVSYPMSGVSNNVATVSITVNPVNDVPSFTKGADQTVLEDAVAQTVTGWATNISAGPPNEKVASCPPFAPPVCGQTVSFVVTVPPDKAALFSVAPAVAPDGTLTYTPAPNANGTATVTVTAVDTGLGLFPDINKSAPQTFVITITPVNDKPTATGQSVSTDEDTDALITLTGNDVETASANLIATITQGPGHGTLEGTWPSYTYKPAADYSGPDSFKFTVTDRGDPDSCGAPAADICTAVLTSEVATVGITVNPVNDTPKADSQNNVSTNEDTAKIITLTGSDLETAGQNLRFDVTASPLHGELSTLTATGSGSTITYTPDEHYNGPDSFKFTATDRGEPDGCAGGPPSCSASLQSTEATVLITVNPVNDQPSANSQAVIANEATAKIITLTGSDVETCDLTFSIVTGPSHGILSAITNTACVANTDSARVKYTPAAGYVGSDSFTFKVHDTGDGSSPALDSAPATVSITVNAGPLIVGNTAAFGFGPIWTFHFSTGATVGGFVPTGAFGTNNGRGVEVFNDEVYYTELTSGFGPTDSIRVAPFNGGAGGADTRTLANPRPGTGIQDLAFFEGVLYVLTGYDTDPLRVFGLDPATGNVLSGPVAIAGPASPTTDGFTVLPNGNFLMNNSDMSCTYNQYDPTTGAPIVGTQIVVPDAAECTGVDTDGLSLFFMRNFNSITKTTMDGVVISTTAVGSHDIEDISLVR